MTSAWSIFEGSTDLPAGWDLVRIRDVASLTNGYPFSSDDFAPSGDLPLVRIRDLLTNSFETFVSGESPRDARIDDGDLIIGMDGDFNVRLWKRGPAALNQRLCCLRPRQGTDIRFLAYALPRALSVINDLTFSTTVKHLSSSQVLSERIPWPQVEEQQRIADFLDDRISEIDRLMAVKEATVARLDERRVALISQRCFRGVHGEPLRASGIGPIGDIPESWHVARNKLILREMADLSRHGDEELLSVSHITGITPRSEKNVYMFLAESMEGYKRVRPADLVINTLWAWMGALGVSKFSGIVSPAYGVYEFTTQDAVPEYFDLLYRTPEYVCEMTRYSKGVWTSRLRLYPEAFLSLRVPLPSRAEQIEIVTTIEKELEPDRHLRDAILRSIRLLEERRSALISAAVTGQIDVTTARGVGVA
ncbi:restriction endonuclease subunit S [Kribbella sp. NPDC051137]|uniref:restriction endonuclease subunit S n=1 Tax=Kribbella sp. NPDC051137 TaxID=3155045 RepID=UPI00344255FE